MDTYGAKERKAKKLGSMGSISSLISAIGGGRSVEAGGRKPSTSTGDGKKKRWKKGNKRKGKNSMSATAEMAGMLAKRYKDDTTFTMGQ